MVLLTGVLTSYMINVINMATGERQNFTKTDTNLASYSVSGLECCTQYMFNVRASTSAGVGDISATASFRTMPDLSGDVKYALLHTKYRK